MWAYQNLVAISDSSRSRRRAPVTVGRLGVSHGRQGRRSRMLDTMSLSGGQWGVVIGLSLIAPAVVGIDKAIQLSRQRKTAIQNSPAPTPSRVSLVTAPGQPSSPMSGTEA
jgi:hypothetical protein